MNTKKGLNCYIFSNLIITFLSLNFLINEPLPNELANTKDSNILNNVYETEVLANSNLTMSYNKTQEVNNNTPTRISVSRVSVNSQNYISYIKPSYNSVTGASLVEYAKHYLGLRYVHAGNSLSTGTDCSGFTMLIFREFGINLGRTVGSQIYSGKYVSKNDLRPGDLVFYGYSRGYATHVGIYMGNGLVIHQSNPRDGVKINSVNMMVYITARRLITSNVTINTKEDNKDETKTEINKESEDKKVESKDPSVESETPKEDVNKTPEEVKPETDIPKETPITPNDNTNTDSGKEENKKEEKEESKEEPKTPTDDSLNKENTSGNDTVSDLDS